MKTKYILLLVLVLLGLGFFINSRNTIDQNKNSSSTTNQKQQKIFQTQTNTNGAVTVEATPKTLDPRSEAQFNLVFNTHSVDLDFDLVKTAQLMDDKGKIYKAISWNGGKGGHHIEGILTFSALLGETKSVIIIIPRIDGFDRKFTWNLE